MPRQAPSEPPKVMTWGRALPVLIIAGIFDALRFMFSWFIFFGPAFAVLFCTIKAGEYVGTTIGGVACTATGLVGGTIASGAIEVFGVIMAMATAFVGWLVVGLILVITNSRIFKENALQFAASLLVGVVPIIGSIPAITIVVWRMYRTQIRIEKVERKKFEKEQAAARKEQEREALLRAHMQQQEAANEALYREEEVVSDEMPEEEIPDAGRRVA